ncbi:hypothetical protein EG68_11564 [Paragonimus skrjabini miyazakii]|uniref:Uncharacterized protein n=1 Tax=Paragonimus skrjabini miyazakii TaxID=59628 RepID=A0A8S9YFC1_9TREM|nr:hypothetical protein EG68_11564 [Paragonimus skrjabini miyazakii]
MSHEIVPRATTRCCIVIRQCCILSYKPSNTPQTRSLYSLPCVFLDEASATTTTASPTTTTTASPTTATTTATSQASDGSNTTNSTGQTPPPTTTPALTTTTKTATTTPTPNMTTTGYAKKCESHANKVGGSRIHGCYCLVATRLSQFGYKNERSKNKRE